MPYKDPTKQKEYFRKYNQEHRKQRSEQNAAWRQLHHEEVLAKKKQWYIEHPGYNAANSRQWRTEHPDYGTIYHHKWREDNPEKQKAAVARQNERIKQRRKTNPEEIRVKGRMYSYRHRALGKLKAEDIAYIATRDNWKCGICGRRVSRTSFSIDHILPVSRGGTNARENLQLAHLRCNHRKSNVGIAQLRLT